MKQKIKFNLTQQSKIIEAMESYRRRLKGVNQNRFDLILEKVKAKQTAYDSEEMIYIVQALRAFSKLLNLLHRSIECAQYRSLADYIEKKRIEFQAKHNPLNRLMAKAQ